MRLKLSRQPAMGLTKAAQSKLSSHTSSSFGDKGGYHLGPFPSNEWRTSKYTLLNFLPRNLFEQFRRLANFYFLITAIIQIFLPFSPVGPLTSLMPLVFVVGVTAIKQGYEDFLRHKSDSQLNNRSCHVWRAGRLIRVRSKDIRVGEIVYVRNNEEIPCDMILLAGSAGSSSDQCYITTSNLDGETNLKSRNCTCIREQLGDIDHITRNSLLLVECDLPNATLYEFNGSLKSPKNRTTYEFIVNHHNHHEPEARKKESKSISQSGVNSGSSGHWSQEEALAIIGRVQRVLSNPPPPNKTGATANNAADSPQHNEPNSQSIHEIPLDITNLLPRASRLRNTNHIYGLALYTGLDTKLAQNLQVKPNKFSSTEYKVNTFLLFSFVVLLAFTFASTLLYSRPTEWYLRDLEKDDALPVIGLAHFLLYNYLMPISLYVTLEFVKFFSTMSVTEDKKMIDKHLSNGTTSSNDDGISIKSRPDGGGLISETGNNKWKKKSKLKPEGPKCNSSDLNEELGQIEVLFSDKTGTLTENRMTFMAASINGLLYRDLDHQLYTQRPSSQLLQHPAVNVAQQMASMKRGRHALLPNLLGGGSTGAQKERISPKSRWTPGSRPFDHRQKPDVGQLQPIKHLEEHQSVIEFFMCLCLCSTITLNENDPIEICIAQRNHLSYAAASPDEESFISAANHYGVSMCKSNDRDCFILIKKSHHHHHSKQQQQHSGELILKPIIETKLSTSEYYVRHFRKLALLEFNSTRKRMSVICEDVDQQSIVMITKGSEELLDCCILANLNHEQQKQFNLTLALFEAFSRSGLRTLLVARRFVKQEEFLQIGKTMKDVRMTIQNREQLLDSFYAETERNLILLGSTAVEDSLQEGVPEMIANLKEAGIKVWLLTGDKVETALSVAQLCNLLDDKQHLFHLVRQRNFQSCQQLLTGFVNKLEESAKSSAQRIKSAIKQDHNHANSHENDQENQQHQQQQQFTLVADGRSLHYAMRHSRSELSLICQQCACVLGCRLSPLQKAEVVAMMKGASHKPITAAIGDGANDVSMIQEAHVGIGISGKEGRQAVNSSDFAIGRFKMLRRLLFVHGHIFYHRTANIILYFFYKNFLFMAPQFIYSFHNLASAQSLYAPLMMVGFNLFWTSIPILLYGLTEVHIPDQLLETYPRLYSINRGNVQMRLRVFLSWISLGFIQGFIVFYLLYFIWGSHTPLLESGHTSTMNGFPIILFSAIVALANLRLYFISHHQTFLFHLSAFASMATLPISLYVYSLFHWASSGGDNSFHGQVLTYFRSIIFWLAILVAVSAALLPELVWHIRNQIQFHKQICKHIEQTSFKKTGRYDRK